MTSVLKNTPIECHKICGKEVWVKREDLCCEKPAPPFSKMRGLYSHLKKLKNDGIQFVGYVETSISMAGWGVCYVCQQLGMAPVLYDPQYKETPSVLSYHRKQWEQFSPTIVPIPAGRAKVGYYVARKHMAENYKDYVLLPLGIPLKESVNETAKEWRRTMEQIQPKTTVICVGSGTICAGIIHGWKSGDGKIIGILARSGNVQQKIKEIQRNSGKLINGLTGVNLQIFDPGWNYTDHSDVFAPFPTHPYYDKKAWQWMVENIDKLRQPILFWNIGRMK